MSLAHPRSPSRTWFLPVRNTFLGFRSRWRMLREWSSLSALQIWMVYDQMVSSLMYLLAFLNFSIWRPMSPPSANSITMYRLSFSVNASQYLQQCEGGKARERGERGGGARAGGASASPLLAPAAARAHRTMLRCLIDARMRISLRASSLQQGCGGQARWRCVAVCWRAAKPCRTALPLAGARTRSCRRSHTHRSRGERRRMLTSLTA